MSIRHRRHEFLSPKSSGQEAFSLLEVLFATSLVALMAALMVPALEGFTSSGGRKGAVITVMNALEHARVAAISRSAEVRVYLWKKSGVDAQDSLMVVLRRDSTDEFLTRWIELPRGVLFDNAGFEGVSPSDDLPEFPGENDPDNQDLVEITFTPTGALAHTEQEDQLFIALTEGQRAEDGTLSVDRQKRGGQEIIGLARLTGRATLDISAL